MTDRVAIVTGAGSGIGAAVVDALAALEYCFVLVGRRFEPLAATAERVGGAARSIIVTADLAQRFQASSIVGLAMERWGRVDVLVNNAARAEIVPFPDVNDDLLERNFALNAGAPARLIRLLWPYWVAAGSGCVVNISSMAVVDPFPGLSAYAASKCALDSLTRSIQVEGAEAGIRAWSVAPGAVETAMLRGLISKDELPESETIRPAQIARIVCECVTGARSEPPGSVILVGDPD